MTFIDGLMVTCGLIGSGFLYTSFNFYLRAQHYREVKEDLFGPKKKNAVLEYILPDEEAE